MGTINVRELYGQWRSLGFGIVWTLNSILLFSGKLASRDLPRDSDFFDLALSVGMVGTCALLFVYCELACKDQPNKPSAFDNDASLFALYQTLISASGILYIIGTLCICTEIVFPMPHVTRVVSGLICGTASALGFYSWIGILAMYGWEVVRLRILVCYAIGTVLFCMGIVLPAPGLIALMIILALVMTYMGRTMRVSNITNPSSQSVHWARQLSSRSVRGIVVAMLILSFIYGISGPMFKNSVETVPLLCNPEINQALTIILSVVITFLMAVFRGERNNPLTLISICYLIDGTAAFLVPFAPDWYVSVFNIIALTVFRVAALAILGICIAMEDAHLRHRATPILLSCIWIGLSCGIGFAYALYYHAGESNAVNGAIVLMIIYLVFTSTSIYSLTKRKMERSSAPAQPEASEDPSAPATTPDPHELISERYNLNAREREIMELLVRGRTAKYIAEDLTLSINTVKSYTKSLYSKMNVHSKQELIDLTESIANE